MISLRSSAPMTGWHDTHSIPMYLKCRSGHLRALLCKSVNRDRFIPKPTTVILVG